MIPCELSFNERHLWLSLKTWLSLCFKILKKSHNKHNNPEVNQIKISRVFICTDAYTNNFRG